MAVCKPSQLQRYRSGTEIESTESDFTVKVESEFNTMIAKADQP